MKKTKNTKNAKNATTKKAIYAISSILSIIVVCFAIMLFFTVPNGDAITKAMRYDDYGVVSDVNSSTPALSLLLPKGANRSIVFTKNVNLDITIVTVFYFDDSKSLKAYKDSIDTDENYVALKRGKALFVGPTKQTKSLRWKLWA